MTTPETSLLDTNVLVYAADHRGQEEDDGLFWADIDEGAVLTVGPYTAGFFWED